MRRRPGSVAISLGEGDLTAVEQASLFATLANGGVYHTPHVITRLVEPTGELPLKIVTRPVLSTAQAADVDYALSADNIPGGTAYPQAAWPGYTVIGKTGTTQTAQDAWFIGAIPQQSLAVTLFTNSQNSVSGPGQQTLDVLPRLAGNTTGGYGGAWPAYIWHSFMTTTFGTLPPAAFGTPDYIGFDLWNQVTGNGLPMPVKAKKPNPTPSSGPGGGGGIRAAADAVGLDLHDDGHSRAVPVHAAAPAAAADAARPRRRHPAAGGTGRVAAHAVGRAGGQASWPRSQAHVGRRVRRLADDRGARPPGRRPRSGPGRSGRTPARRAGPGPEPNSSRELLQCTRSIRPVMALTRSTIVARSSPAACAWQVSRQKPTSPPAGIADRVPQPGDALQAAGHGAVAAGGVLDQHRQRPLDPLDRLAPAVVALLRVGRPRSRARRARSARARRSTRPP